jgi:Holliday junction DNA helicase RuvA
MIAKLTGKIDNILEDSIIIDVNGIGFQVLLSAKLQSSFSIGQEVSLRIYQIFRQEQQYLCGFSNEEELAIFKALLDVHGVGIKSAMSVLSILSIEEFAVAVANQEPGPFHQVTGIGKKTAERILLELKDRNITKIKDMNIQGTQNINDAILGLMSLGYQRSVVIKTVSEVVKTLGSNALPNEIIIQCLKIINNLSFI